MLELSKCETRERFVKMTNCVTKIQLVVLALLLLSGTVAAQRETIIWSKQDADPLLNVAFSTDGSMLALGRQDSNTSDFLDADTGNLIRSFTGNHNTTNDLVFTLDDQYLINGVGGGGSTLTLSLWRVSDGTRLIGPIGDHNNGTNSVSLSHDGQYLVTSGNFSRDIKIRRASDLTLILTIPNNDPHNPSLPPRVKDSAFSPDGQLIASSDIYGIKLRRSTDGVLVLTIPSAEIPSIAFSPNGVYIAGAVESEEAVKLWRVSDGALVFTLTVDTGFEFPRIAFSPSGSVIAACYGNSDGSGAIKFWRVTDGSVLAVFPKANHVHSIAFSPRPGIYAYTEFDGLVTVARARFVR